MTISDEEAEALRAENESMKRIIDYHENEARKPRPLSLRDFFGDFGCLIIPWVISFIIWALLR